MKLSVIGTGKMGTSLIKSALDSNTLTAGDIYAYDKSTDALNQLTQEVPGINVCTSAVEAADKGEVLLLAVKPQDMLTLVSHIIRKTNDETPLIVSIAAGISLHSLQKAFRDEARIIRMMPNTPSIIGQGASGYSVGMLATPADVDIFTRLFAQTGLLIQVPESQIDALSAISGSGPAYMFTILDAITSAGIAMGLSKDISAKLAMQTMLGSAALAQQSEKHLMELRDEVTSPGGTTIQALHKMEELGLRHALIEGIKSAQKRALELATPNTVNVVR